MSEEKNGNGRLVWLIMTLAVGGLGTLALSLYAGITSRQEAQEARIQIALEKAAASEMLASETNKRLDRMENKLDALMLAVRNGGKRE